MKQQWEYKIVGKDAEQLTHYLRDEFDELGKKGWELVAVHRRQGQDVFFFKRHVYYVK